MPPHNHDADYVNVTGDRMTSDLHISTPSGDDGAVMFETGDVLRWQFGKNPNAETGGNLGSDFTIARYSDAGAWLNNPIEIQRWSGAVLTGPPTVGGKALSVHDSGWRSLTSSLLNGWSATSVTIRRQGNLVILRIKALNAASKTANVFVGTAVGFVPALDVQGLVGTAASAGALVRQVTNSASNTLQISTSQTSDQTMSGTIMWFTDEAWPTSYPGTAA